MLVLQTQHGSSEPEWIEFDFKGEKFKITAFKKRTMIKKNSSTAVIMFIKCENRDIKIHRTKTFLERLTGKTVASRHPETKE